MRVNHCSLLAALLTVPAQATATIYNLGTLPGGVYTRGNAINASGQIAGSTDPVNAGNHAFLYSGIPGSGGTMHDLGTLEGTVLSWDSEGYAVNSSGQVTGVSQKVVGYDYNWHAFLYSGTPGLDGMMHDLGTLGGRNSTGWAINDSGQVAGHSYTSGGSYSNRHAFLYTGMPGNGGVMRDLGTLGGTYSHGYGINASGQVSGSSSTASGAQHAFLYSGTPGSGGVMHDLGTLGGTEIYGYAINDSGQVAGSSQITGNTATHAFLYTGTPGVDGVMHDLGTLGGMYSQGYAINASGQVAGSSSTASGAQHAVLYTGTPGVDGTMIDLDAWLDANNPTEGGKWTLPAAVGLTDTGLITGTGEYYDGPGGLSDGLRAFILDASALISSSTPGDANKDGVVNSVDFDYLVANYGTLSGATWAMGDFDGDDKVTTTDFNLLAGNFGGSATAMGVNVPEPVSIFCIAVLVLPRRRRRVG